MTPNKNKKAAPRTKTGRPVPGFPLSFSWLTGEWQLIFDEQIRLVKSEVARARAENRLIVYLSCPISSRGGGWSGTNVDIAKHVERRLLDRWGEAFWILNPAKYQLESKAGVGLFDEHARKLNIDIAKLIESSSPGGGDYMRMWTQVLVEDGKENLGHNFDAYYFLGPRDVFSFFSQDETLTLTAGIEAYFARKFAFDPEFRDAFSNPAITWGKVARTDAEFDQRNMWVRMRMEFLRFYGLRASANFSLGSHDEWAILNLINDARRKKSITADKVDGDVGDQLTAYFDGAQVDPAASQATISRGYAVK